MLELPGTLLFDALIFRISRFLGEGALNVLCLPSFQVGKGNSTTCHPSLQGTLQLAVERDTVRNYHDFFKPQALPFICDPCPDFPGPPHIPIPAALISIARTLGPGSRTSRLCIGANPPEKRHGRLEFKILAGAPAGDHFKPNAASLPLE
jgi:hypothetical protein